MLRSEADADWKELCYLWASDFRTHLTEKRWAAYCARLAAAEARWSAPPAAAAAPAAASQSPTRHIDDRNAVTDARGWTGGAGWRLQSLHFAASASPRWAACRTAISTTSRCRPTGTPATACSRRRASTSSPTWNGARRELAHDANGDVIVHRPHRNAQRADRKTAALLRRRAARRIRPARFTGATGARACCGWAISPCCPTPSIWRA